MDSAEPRAAGGREEAQEGPERLEELAATDRSGPEGGRPVDRGPHPVSTIPISIEGGTAEVELSLVDNRIEATGVYVTSDRPITTSLMRAVPWASRIEEAKRKLLGTASATQDVEANVRRQRDAWPGLSEETYQRIAEAVARAARKAIPPLEAGLGRPGRPRELGAEHFAEVALVYSEAWRAGSRAPTKAVQQHFGTSRSTAAKWVARARAIGLLPPTEPRVPRGRQPIENEGEEER